MKGLDDFLTQDKGGGALMNWCSVRSVETGQELNLDPWAVARAGHASGDFDIFLCTTSDEWGGRFTNAGFVQDPDVLDTWFSSALWPHSTLGWPEPTPDLARYYPTSVLLTGRDIITLWVARMVMMGMYNMGLTPSPLYAGERVGVRGHFEENQAPSTNVSSPQPSGARESCRADAARLGIPFLDVAINPTILDGKGERMSKTKGNGVDPVDIIFSHGADALRFTLTTMATETQDARMPVQVVCPHCGNRLPNPDGKDPAMLCPKCKKKLTRPVNNATGSADAPFARMTSEKFDLGRNFCNKLWNACRFALSNLEAAQAHASAGLAPSDPTDPELMFRSQQGDQSSFAILHDRYIQTVTSELRRLLGAKQDIESLGTEVFLRAFRFAATYKPPGKVSTWLLTIARNVALGTAPDPQTRAEIMHAIETIPENETEMIALNPAVTAFSTADRWIIARFHHAVAESNEALAAYRFDVYAKACYDFFWRDFCDWYVEAIKPAMKDPSRAPQTANVLAAVLDGALRLMHPMIPFITETIWWRLNDIRPVRGLPGLLECPPSKRLVLAQWPALNRASTRTPVLRYSEEPGSPPSDPGLRGTSDPALSSATERSFENNAEAIFTRLQEVIVAIRTIRNDYQVNPKQAVKVSIKAPADFAAHIEANRELIELLATSSIQALGSAIAQVPNAVTASAGGADIFVEGLIDENAERTRLTKELETEEKTVAALNGRMSNEAYMAKAPPKLVQQTREQLAAAEVKIGKLKEAIAKLG